MRQGVRKGGVDAGNLMHLAFGKPSKGGSAAKPGSDRPDAAPAKGVFHRLSLRLLGHSGVVFGQADFPPDMLQRDFLRVGGKAEPREAIEKRPFAVAADRVRQSVDAVIAQRAQVVGRFRAAGCAVDIGAPQRPGVAALRPGRDDIDPFRHARRAQNVEQLVRRIRVAGLNHRRPTFGDCRQKRPADRGEEFQKAVHLALRGFLAAFGRVQRADLRDWQNAHRRIAEPNGGQRAAGGYCGGHDLDELILGHVIDQAGAIQRRIQKGGADDPQHGARVLKPGISAVDGPAQGVRRQIKRLRQQIRRITRRMGARLQRGGAGGEGAKIALWPGEVRGGVRRVVRRRVLRQNGERASGDVTAKQSFDVRMAL